MSENLRPRRSVLYMPGANERALEKAKGIPADSLILDLEDAVAPDAKADAHDRVCAAVRSGEYGAKELTIRINGIGTEWHDADMAAAAAAGPDGILVPKVNSATEVCQLVDDIVAAGAPDTTKLWAMLETPVAILHAEEIVTASTRLAVLVMGTNDLAKELHAEHVPGRTPLLYGLQACLLAARLDDKVILDGVYNDIKDDEGFRAECVQGRELGFDGKTLIHPAQVEPCNDVFAPSEDEIATSREIIAAFEEARAEGRGVVTVNGRMIENLHVDNARRVLAVADAIAAPWVDPDARKRARRGVGAVVVAVVAVLAGACTSSGTEDTSVVTGALPTSTTVGGPGPAVRVPTNDPASISRLFEGWAIGQDGDGYVGECAPDRATMPAAETWCSVALGSVTADGDTYVLAHPGSTEPYAALLVGPRNGYYVIADDFTYGSGTPPGWVGTSG